MTHKLKNTASHLFDRELRFAIIGLRGRRDFPKGLIFYIQNSLSKADLR